MEEQPLPEGWRWVPLGAGTISTIIMGQSPPGITYNDRGEGLPFFQGKTDFGDIYPTVRIWCTQPLKVSQVGDVLISVRAPVGPTNLTPEECIIGRGLAALRPTERVETKYLLYAVRSLEKSIEAQGTGSTFKAISKSSLSSVRIPVPHPDNPALSLGTQRRIVARIEALSAELRAAQELHRKVVEDTNRLMEAVQREVFVEVDIRFQKVRLQPLTLKIGSGSTPRGGRAIYKSTGIPFIRSLNVRWNEFSFDDLVYIDEATHSHMASTEVRPGDVLLNITGASIGRACCVPEHICPANVNQHVSIIRPTSDLNPRFLMYWLTSPNTQGVINYTQAGATRQALTKRQIEDFQIPKPPKPVQDSLVEYLDSMGEQIVEMRSTESEDGRLLKDMEGAILARAFQGDL